MKASLVFQSPEISLCSSCGGSSHFFVLLLYILYKRSVWWSRLLFPSLGEVGWSWFGGQFLLYGNVQAGSCYAAEISLQKSKTKISTVKCKVNSSHQTCSLSRSAHQSPLWPPFLVFFSSLTTSMDRYSSLPSTKSCFSASTCEWMHGISWMLSSLCPNEGYRVWLDSGT